MRNFKLLEYKMIKITKISKTSISFKKQTQSNKISPMMKLPPSYKTNISTSKLPPGNSSNLRPTELNLAKQFKIFHILKIRDIQIYKIMDINKELSALMAAEKKRILITNILTRGCLRQTKTSSTAESHQL